MPTGARDRPARPRTTKSSLDPNSSRFFIAILLLLASSSKCSAQDANESQPLLRFKAALQTNNHHLNRRLASWKASSGPPCSATRAAWAHVLCYKGLVFGLQLENMGLRGPIDVDPLVPLRSLRTLSFMGNNLVGPMPDWRKLGALKSLYLTNNWFSGQIPEEAFRGMFSLKKIDLANNSFTGPLPTSLESPKLTELRLENNNFTGHIPPISSEHLKIIDLSNNQLEGPIPEPLRKMSAASFIGNKALCGLPLEAVCPTDASSPDGAKTGNTRLRTALIVISVLAVLFVAATIILLAATNRRRRRSHTPRLGGVITPADDVEASSHVATLGVAKKSSAKPKSAAFTSSGGGSPSNRLTFVRGEQRTFELQDLMTASAEVLGSGNFGASYKAVLADEASSVLVVKRFKQMSAVPRDDFSELMARLGGLRHPNLLPLVAYLYRKQEKLLVFEYATNGSLAANLHGGGGSAAALPWPTRLSAICGICRGLAYLHRELPSLTLPHGHLKSSNVLLDKDFNPLLADYSLYPIINQAHVHEILVAYKAPEHAKKGKVGREADVWCLGVLMLEVLTGKYVAHGSGSMDLTAGYINAIVGDGAEVVFDKGMAASDEEEMGKVLEIAKECCREEPEARPRVEEVLSRVELLHKES